MPAEIDPLSQLLGGITAQVQSLGAGLVDLRSEIMANRTAAQTRWDQLAKEIELVHAEYRNVKHIERDVQQKEIAVDSRLRKIENRLEEIERVILTWRTRLSVLAVIGLALGTVIGWTVHTTISIILPWIFK